MTTTKRVGHLSYRASSPPVPPPPPNSRHPLRKVPLPVDRVYRDLHLFPQPGQLPR